MIVKFMERMYSELLQKKRSVIAVNQFRNNNPEMIEKSKCVYFVLELVFCMSFSLLSCLMLFMSATCLIF